MTTNELSLLLTGVGIALTAAILAFWGWPRR